MKKKITYIPLLIIAGVFTMHAILGGILGGEEYFQIVGGLGLSKGFTTLLVHGLLPLDGGIALLLIFGNKISRTFPWHLLFLWTGLWPWIPRLLEWNAGMEVEIIDAVVMTVLSGIAYHLYKKSNTVFFAS